MAPWYRVLWKFLLVVLAAVAADWRRDEEACRSIEEFVSSSEFGEWLRHTPSP